MATDLDQLLDLARQVHGPLYADLLRADYEITKREAASQQVPPSWRAKRQWLARKLDTERARFERLRYEARRELWK